MAKHVSVTPKGGDALEVLRFFEKRAEEEQLMLPEVEIASTELVEKFTRQVINPMISMHLLHVE